ncbi:MAG: low molecular weight phosphatase family protein [Fimbriimonadaceae bacterium]|nr:low molecular weight phosphatase family protein [Fimbriimonadaceae bacterium]
MTVLFVCVHNAGRSQAAEALFRHHALAAGLSVRSESAGTLGGGSLNPAVVRMLEARGVSTADLTPKQLTVEMVARADRIISMGCGVDAEACPAKFWLTEDWGLDDPKGRPDDEVAAILDQVEARVHDLISRIQTSA